MQASRARRAKGLNWFSNRPPFYCFNEAIYIKRWERSVRVFNFVPRPRAGRVLFSPNQVLTHAARAAATQLNKPRAARAKGPGQGKVLFDGRRTSTILSIRFARGAGAARAKRRDVAMTVGCLPGSSWRERRSDERGARSPAIGCKPTTR